MKEEVTKEEKEEVTNEVRKMMLNDLLTRNVDNSVDIEYVRERIMKSEKLNVKLGIDPTSPHIHIGRAVVLWKLRAFQDLGCHVTFIIGDFTGTIGDTSDKNSERPMIDQDTVNKNLETYIEQALLILDKDKNKLSIRKNSEWLSQLTYSEVCAQADAFSVNDFIKRDVIARRLGNGSRVSLREMLYPMLQGYDSVAINADIEIGGSDQWFNLLAGRTMQKLYRENGKLDRKNEQAILTVKLIPGLDGRKMSSSYGNGIFLTDTVENMYGKAMTINDNLMIEAFEGFTHMSIKEIENLKTRLLQNENPKNIKEILAYEITKLYHGETGANKGREAFKNISLGVPTEIKNFKINKESNNLVDILIELNFATSKSNARTVIEQGGVKVNDEVVSIYKKDKENTKYTNEYIVQVGDIIQKGKLNYAKII